MIKPDELYDTPNRLASHYSMFRVADRLLLTGHSHQAWPDRGFVGQQQAWRDAAEYVDEKWDRAFETAERVRRGYYRLLGDDGCELALGQNTHELVVRFLSGLRLQDRPRVVTTDGEFHTIRRQLDRLAEEGVEVVKVASLPAGTLAERVIQSVNDRTAAALVSSVLFHNAHIVPNLGAVSTACLQAGTELLVDAYHALNVVPFSVEQEQLDGAFIVGGGYKYCQLGEGNCFLRVPPDTKMRPVVTGWFAEFATLSDAADSKVKYGTGHARFDGATYDPTSHYRAAEVFDFFVELNLTPALLREVSQHQIELLARSFDVLDADPQIITRDRSVDLDAIGGFLALLSENAEEISRLLRERGVATDYRGEVLRLGPAPYLSDRQLSDAMEVLREVLQTVSSPTRFSA